MKIKAATTHRATTFLIMAAQSASAATAGRLSCWLKKRPRPQELSRGEVLCHSS